MSWSFAAGELQNDRLASTDGKHKGQVHGTVKLEPAPNRIELDGFSRVIVANDIANFALPTEAVTVETWVRVDKAGKWCGFVSAIQDNGSFERGWLLGFQDGRFCFGLVSESKRRITYLTSADSIALGAWYHVAGVYDGKSMKLFVDGELAAASTAQSGPVIYSPRGVVALGSYVDDNEAYPLQGAMAATAIWGEALTAKALGKRFAEEKSSYPNVDPAVAHITGWPTYMHDDARSGATNEEVTLPLHLQWTYTATHRPKPAWPPPAKQNFWANKHDLRARVTFDRAFHVVSDGTRVYFGSSADDQVRALDLKSGRPIWSVYTEGPVRLAPTIANGRAYFGSDDGRVYCVSAETGEPIWQFEAWTGDQRVIPGNSRLISTFPVRTGVLVEDSIARFGSGLFPSQGTFQFAVDTDTGKELARGKLSFSPQGYLKRQGGALRIAQGRAPTATFATVPSKSKKTNGVTPVSRHAAYPFAWIRAGDVHFGGGDGEVAAFAQDADTSTWKAQVNGKAISLAVAGDRFLVSTDEGSIYCFGTPPGKKVDHAPTIAEFAWNDSAEQLEFDNWAKNIIRHIDVEAGYGLLLGGDARHAWMLAQQTKLRIVAIKKDNESAAKMRQRLSDAGVYGSVVVRVGKNGGLPFASRLFNLVVIADPKDRWSPDVLAPLVRPWGGILIDPTAKGQPLIERRRRYDRWMSQSIRFETIESGDEGEQSIVLRRKQLDGEGNWTHMYGDAANTSCSNDSRVKGELDLQWFGPPGPREMIDRHHRATPPLYTGGRLFVPGNETIYGVDAYNGAVLWQSTLSGFRRVGAPRDGGNMAAAPETLYAVAKDRVYALAASDGTQRASFDPPALGDGKPRDWGFVAVVSDSLYGSSTWPDASRSDHNRDQISETYYDFVPVVTSDSVFCLDRKTGKLKWRFAAHGAILNPTIVIGGDRVCFVESRNPSTLDEKLKGRVKLTDLFRDKADLVALDRNTGKELWRREAKFSKVQHHLYLAYANEKLVAVGTRNEKQDRRDTVRYDLAAFDARTGDVAWTATQDQGQSAGGSHGEQDHHLAIIGDVVVQEPYTYDLHTGNRRKDWRFARGGHGCGSISASASAFFFRAGNPTMCDLTTGQRTKVNTVSRPGCWINIIPAGGMLLIPEASSGCTCNFAIQSSMAFSPREGGKSK